MSMANRRSWQKHHVGYVHLTVEAEPTDIDRNLDRHRGLAKVTEQLFEMFNRHRLPATWAVGDPAHSAVGRARRCFRDTTWARAVGRSVLDRQDRRPHAVRPRAGPPRVSGPHGGDRGRDARATRGAGRRAHRPGGEAGNSGRRRSDRRRDRQAAIARPGPRALHYGVWEFSTTERLPLRSSWLPGGGWKLFRTIRRGRDRRRDGSSGDRRVGGRRQPAARPRGRSNG